MRSATPWQTTPPPGSPTSHADPGHRSHLSASPDPDSPSPCPGATPRPYQDNAAHRPCRTCPADHAARSAPSSIGVVRAASIRTVPTSQGRSSAVSSLGSAASSPATSSRCASRSRSRPEMTQASGVSSPADLLPADRAPLRSCGRPAERPVVVPPVVQPAEGCCRCPGRKAPASAHWLEEHGGRHSGQLLAVLVEVACRLMGAGIRCGHFVHFGESGSEGTVGGVELQVRKTAPRACGDGPPARPTPHAAVPCSPRLRGWARVGDGERSGRAVRRLLPAPAGMGPTWALARNTRSTCRCTRERGSGKNSVGGDHLGDTVSRSAYCRRRWAIRTTRWRRSGTPARPAISRFCSLTSVMRPSLTPEL